MGATAKDLAIIGVLAGVVLFTNLGGPKLWDRDEPRNARCAVEMLEQADWVTPTFNGELRTHKPVLTYWLMMAAYSAFGVSEFSARFWSATLGLGTVLLTYAMGRRLCGRAVGLWAAVILCTTLMFNVAAHAATPDAPLIFCMTAALAVYVFGTFAQYDGPPRPSMNPRPTASEGCRTDYFPQSWPVVVAMYACMGLAVLAKGPVGVVLPTAVIGMFLLVMRLPEPPTTAAWKNLAWHRLTFLHWSLIIGGVVGLAAVDRFIGPTKTFGIVAAALIAWAAWRPNSMAAALLRPFHPRHFLGTCWAMRPITAIITVLAVAGPWYVWVGLRTDGQWMSGFFWTHNFARATQVFEGHSGSFLFYPITALVGVFPWSIFLAAALTGAATRIRQEDPWRVPLIFMLCWIGVFVGLFSLASTKLPSYITPCYPALAMLLGVFVHHWTQGSELAGKRIGRYGFAVLALVGVGLAVGLPVAASVFMPSEQWLGVVGLVPLLAAGVCWWLVNRQRQRGPAAVVYAVGAAALLIALFGLVADRAGQHQRIDTLLSAANQACESPRLATFGAHEPSWVFYAGQSIPPAASNDANQIVGELGAHDDLYVLMPESRFNELQPHLPPSVGELARERFFLKKYDLVLVGRTREAWLAAREAAVIR